MPISYSTMTFTVIIVVSPSYSIPLSYNAMAFVVSHLRFYPIVLWHSLYHIHVSILEYFDIHSIVFVSLSYSTVAFTVIISMSLSYSTIAFAVPYSCFCPIVLWHSMYHIHVSILYYYGIRGDNIRVSIL